MIALICAMAGEPNDRSYMLWLYEEFRNLIFSTARRYVGNQSDCEDIIQDSIISLFKKVRTLRNIHDCVLTSYIVATVRNTAINHLKQQSIAHERTISMEESYPEMESDELPLDDMMILIERRAQLSRIWSKLPDEHRILLEGRYILGFSDEDLAKQLHCKPSSIRMKLTRARRVASQLLINEESGDLNDKTRTTTGKR